MFVPASFPLEPGVSGFMSHVIPQLFYVADLFTVKLNVLEGNPVGL